MAVNSGVVTVTTAATALTGTDADNSLYPGRSILVKNPGSVTVYLGGSDVTADTVAATGGYPLAPGESLPFDSPAGEVLYGIVAASTSTVNVLRRGL